MGKETRWVQVGELAQGIGENVLEENHQLTGKSIRLFFQDGDAYRLTFRSPNRLQWVNMEGMEENDSPDEFFRSTCLREDIYLVDFIRQNDRTRSVSLVLDFGKNYATGVFASLPAEEEARTDLFWRVNQEMDLSGVKAIFLGADMDVPFEKGGIEKHPPTTELIGKRVQYVYSRTETYEHIYLNENRYTWHCLSGIEKGLADTDECHYRKIAEKLFLFVWREKIIPTLGVVLIDMYRMKTTGKLFGYASNDFGKIINVPIGAHAYLVNEI
jgi:hypothetical protein